MNWLSACYVTIECVRREILFKVHGQLSCTYVGPGRRSDGFMLHAATEVQWILKDGGEAYLAMALNLKQELPKLQDISVVQDFVDMFPEELPHFPPTREVDFVIEVVTGTKPISKAPNQMGFVELKELKAQLKKLLDRGFIRPSVSPWSASFLFVRKKDVLCGCVLTTVCYIK